MIDLRVRLIGPQVPQNLDGVGTPSCSSEGTIATTQPVCSDQAVFTSQFFPTLPASHPYRAAAARSDASAPQVTARCSAECRSGASASAPEGTPAADRSAASGSAAAPGTADVRVSRRTRPRCQEGVHRRNRVRDIRVAAQAHRCRRREVSPPQMPGADPGRDRMCWEPPACGTGYGGTEGRGRAGHRCRAG
jgi:hypothetical protein